MKKEYSRYFLYLENTPLSLPKSARPLITSTTSKPIPCELPQKSNEKSDDKLQSKHKDDEDKKDDKKDEKKDDIKDEKKEDKKEAEKKPKGHRQRRSPQKTAGNKRCIGDFLRGKSSCDPILGASKQDAAAPSNTVASRYDSKNTIASQNVQSTQAEDNLAEESFLQANAVKNSFDSGSSFAIEKPKGLDFLSKFSLPSKSEKLFHGNILNSFESNELRPSNVDESSSQFNSASFSKVEPFSVQPIVQPNHEIPQYNPNDYLPSYEYFPKNSPKSNERSQFNAQNDNDDDDDRSSSHFQRVVVGPSSVMTTPLYKKDMVALQDVSLKVEKPPQIPSHPQSSPQGCQCDSEQFEDLLNHMQSGYSKFHNGMMQLFETFKSQSNCGSNVHRDSSSAPSQSQFNYQVECRDRNVVNGNPQLAAKCRDAFSDSRVNPSSGYYQPPTKSDQPGAFENQFLSYADYVKMISNVNANSGTILSSAYDLDSEIAGSSNPNYHHEQQKQTVDQLRQHFEVYQDTPVAAPNPVSEAPASTASTMKKFFETFKLKN